MCGKRERASIAGAVKLGLLIAVAIVIKMPKIDTLDALGEEMTSILNIL